MALELKPGDVVLCSGLVVASFTPTPAPTWILTAEYQDCSVPPPPGHPGHVAKSFVDLDREVQSAKEWVKAPRPE